jgi:phage tail-like protein
MAKYYPPVTFHFKVVVLGIPANENDMRFSEASGLTVEIPTEEVAEGGENRYIQKYPLRPKYSELVLKRGLLVNSSICDWIMLCIDNFNILPKNIDVSLLNEKHEPLMTWHLVNAYPTKWTVSDFNASQNGIVIENLQFYYQRFTLDKS